MHVILPASDLCACVFQLVQLNVIVTRGATPRRSGDIVPGLELIGLSNVRMNRDSGGILAATPDEQGKA